METKQVVEDQIKHCDWNINYHKEQLDKYTLMKEALKEALKHL